MTSDVVSPDDVAAIAAIDKIECQHPSRKKILSYEETLQKVIDVNEPFSANCHATYRACHNSGKRPLNQIDLIVIHDTEGGTARSNALWFKRTESGGSTQIIVDDTTCYRALDDDQIPWGAPGANYHGLHIEQAGYVTWSNLVWRKKHVKTINRAAFKTAFHCRKYGITVRFLSSTDLKRGIRNGITTHLECTKAFGGTHTDPGKNWPRIYFMIMTRRYYAQLKHIKKIA